MDVKSLAIHLGVTVSTLKLVILFIISYPIAIAFRHIPKHNVIRHLYTIVVGLSFYLYTFTVTGLIEMSAATLFTFIATKYYGYRSFTPYLVFAVTMLHLSWKYF
jgi:hypothetical protein